MVIPSRFDGAQSFRRGMAAVLIGEPFEGKGKWGYIDKEGRFLLEPSDSYSYTGFDDGLMQVRMDGKWGYVDITERLSIPCTFEVANPFSGGLAGVRLNADVAGFITTKGEWAIRLESAVPDYQGFSEGLAPVWDSKLKKYGFIDSQGTWAIAPRFDQANGFHEGRAVVSIEGKDDTGWPTRKLGAIDKTGKLIVPLKYDTMWNYEEGLAKVIIADGNGFVDVTGAQVIPCSFTTVDPFQNGLAWVRVGSSDDKTGWNGYVDKNGAFVWSPSDFATRDEARARAIAKEKVRKPSILLLNDPATTEAGLVVTCPKKINCKDEKTVKIAIRVLNLLEDEVFISVTGFGSLGCSLEFWDGGFYIGGGSFTLFPDNTQSLKRLHAATRIGDKRSTCGCCLSTINAEIDVSQFGPGRARGTVSVPISGFYRNSGQSFYETIELPIELVEETEDHTELAPDKK